MNWRLLLLPFSGVYWGITSIRNVSYDIGLFRSKRFTTPVIMCIGNLSVGGTGKSPHVMYIVDLLRNRFRLATLSRGYGRSTKGYVVANYSSKVDDIGDEPLQFFHRFKNSIVVSVCENRAEGIDNLVKKFKPELIILDDGYQHRRVKPSYSILLVDYSEPFFKDYLLPAGNLRESGSQRKRANIIIVTKCPENLSAAEKEGFIKKIKPTPEQKVFFSRIVYSDIAYNHLYTLRSQEWKNYNIVLITGIAKADGFVKWAENNFKSVQHLEYPDHYNFTPSDIQRIEETFDGLDGNKIILTTEKDYMRLKDENALLDDLYYLPINVQLDDSDKFNKIMLEYAGKNQTGS